MQLETRDDERTREAAVDSPKKWKSLRVVELCDYAYLRYFDDGDETPWDDWLSNILDIAALRRARVGGPLCQHVTNRTHIEELRLAGSVELDIVTHVRGMAHPFGEVQLPRMELDMDCATTTRRWRDSLALMDVTTEVAYILQGGDWPAMIIKLEKALIDWAGDGSGESMAWNGRQCRRPSLQAHCTFLRNAWRSSSHSGSR